MKEITCILGRKIKFTKERYSHIIIRHPELEGNLDYIEKTLMNADFVQESIYDKTVQLYYKTIKNKEYFVVVIKVLNNHGFIITAYIANVIKKGEIVWKK